MTAPASGKTYRFLEFVLLNAVLAGFAYWSYLAPRVHLAIQVSEHAVRTYLDGHLVNYERGGTWELQKIEFMTTGKNYLSAIGKEGFDNLKITDTTTNEIIYEESFNDPYIEGLKFSKEGAGVVTRTGELVLTPRVLAIKEGLPGHPLLIEFDMVRMLETLVRGYSSSGDTMDILIRATPDFDSKLTLTGSRSERLAVRAVRWTQNIKTSLGFLYSKLYRFYLHALGLLVLAFAAYSLAVALAWIGRKMGRLVGIGRPHLPKGEGRDDGDPGITDEGRPAPPAATSTLTLTLSQGERGPGSRLFSLLRFLPALALATVATIGLLHVADQYLERVPHVQDSVSQLFSARLLAEGRTWAPAPSIPQAVNMEFVFIRDGRWFGKYPFGWPLLMVPGIWLDKPWAVAPVVGGFGLLLVYLLTMELYGSWLLAMGAMVVTGLTPFFIFLGGDFMNHSAAMFYWVLGFYLFVRCGRTKGLWSALFSGVALGLLFNTRPLEGIASQGALVLYWFAGMLRSPRKKREFALMGAWCVGGLLMLGAFFAYNASITGNPLKVPYQTQGDHFDNVPKSLGSSKWTSFFESSFTIQDINVDAILLAIFNYPFLWLSLAFFLIPLVSYRLIRADWLCYLSVLAVFTVYFPYKRAVLICGPRYFYAIIPFFMILTVRGAFMAGGWAEEFFRRWVAEVTPAQWRRFAGSLPVIALLAWCTYSNAHQFLNNRPYDGDRIFAFLPRKLRELKAFNYTQPLIQRKAAKEGLSDAVVFVDDANERKWYKYGSVFGENDPDLNGTIIYFNDLGKTLNQQVMDFYPNRSFYITRYDATTPLEKIASATKWSQVLSGGASEKNVPSIRKIAVAKNYVVVTDLNNANVYLLNREGRSVLTLTTGGKDGPPLEAPLGLSIDPDGNFAVVDSKSGLLSRISGSGALLSKVNLQAKEDLKNPMDIAFHADGSYFVSYPNANAVAQFSSENKFASVLSLPPEERPLVTPKGLVCSPDGELFIADAGNSRIVKFSSGLEFETEWYPVFWDPDAPQEHFLAFDDAKKHLLTIDTVRKEIERYTDKGDLIHAVPYNPGGEKDATWTSLALAAEIEGESSIAAVNAQDGTVRFDAYPEPPSVYEGGGGSGPGQFGEIRGLDTDSLGNIWVVDKSSGRIQKFASNGRFIRQFGSAGKPDELLRRPHGLKVDGKDRVVVSDIDFPKISRYSLEGKLLDFVTNSDKFRFFAPFDVDVDGQDRVLVANAGHRNIPVFSEALTFELVMGGPGKEDGHFDGDITGLAVDRSLKVVLACDRSLPRIEVFNLEGKFLRHIDYSGVSLAAYVTAGGAHYYLTSTNENRLVFLTNEGHPLATPFSTRTYNGMALPAGFTQDRTTGDLILGDLRDLRVIRVPQEEVDEYLKKASLKK